MKKAQIIPHFLEEYRTGKVRVGFSGGADSTALLLLLLKWGFAAEQLEAVHFDHGLRGSASQEDGEWCRAFCAGLGVKFILVKLDLLQAVNGGCSLEDAARNARLEWYRRHDDNSPIALAHHGDDVQENMLLKLARGGNVSMLASLRKKRKLWNLTFLRPLLDWHKSELEEFLLENNVQNWRCDATNLQSDYHRNFLRNEILSKWADFHTPLNSGLDRAAEVLAMDADFIERSAMAKLAELGEVLPLETSVNYWLELHEALLGRVLRTYLAGISGKNETALTFQNVENFKKFLQRPFEHDCKILQLNKEFSFRLTDGKLRLMMPEKTQDQSEKMLWEWKKKAVLQYNSWRLECEVLPGAVSEDISGVFYFDYDLMPENLYCISRQGGEVMYVWGSSKARRVKHLLSGSAGKEKIFLLTDEDENIYLLGDLRRSIHAPVTEKTSSTIKIVVKSTE